MAERDVIVEAIGSREGAVAEGTIVQLLLVGGGARVGAHRGRVVEAGRVVCRLVARAVVVWRVIAAASAARATLTQLAVASVGKQRAAVVVVVVA